VELSQFAGEFELPAGAALTARLLESQFESYLTDLIQVAVSPGDHVLDVGANLGVYTVLAGKLTGPAGRVLAVEPTPAMLKLLQSNLQRNALDNVSVFPGVVSDRAGTCTLELVAGGEEYSSINGIAHPDVPAGKREKITVASETLDTLVSRFQLHPAVIKVDTEGAESLVFSQADATLQNDRPIIFSELDERLLAPHGASAVNVAERWHACEYELFNAQTGEPYRRGEFPPDFVGDVVALPA
jgi:FkbM family methyltransferase